METKAINLLQYLSISTYFKLTLSANTGKSIEFNLKLKIKAGSLGITQQSFGKGLSTTGA